MTQGATRETMLQYARDTYGTEPDCPFRDTPEAVVLRRETSRRWYALIMNVSRRTLGLPGEGMTDVMNVKADPILILSLRAQPGFLPAYHMNKEQWISILLDGSVERAQAEALLDMSYALTGKRSAARRRKRSEDEF